MIPNEALEKAIEGGWLGVDLPSSSMFVWSESRYGANYEHAGACAIALDPSFWQSLAKALEWQEWNENWGVDGKGYVHAMRFYDLILTGGDTDKFWRDLLDNGTV